MIVGERIALRPFERRHLATTYRWVNDPALARLLDRSSPVSDLEHELWFAHLHEKRHAVYFAIEVILDGSHIGNVWLWNIDWRHRRAEVRVLIGEEKGRGRGMGTESLNLITRYAFSVLNLHKLYAYVLAINPAARRAFEKADFELEGTLRQDRWAGACYIDIYLLGRLNE